MTGKNTSKILFVYDMPPEHQWKDGLWKALQLLGNDFDIQYYNMSGNPPEDPKDPDFILGWGGFGSKVDNFVCNLPQKKGLCIAGNATVPETASKYDVLFSETKWYRDKIKHLNDNIVLAFGANTDLFQNDDMPFKLFDYLGVGAFASWKRWEKMLAKPGLRMVVGYYQNNNEPESLEIVRRLVKGGVMVSNQVNPRELETLYNTANTVYIPADIYGGGERSVMEAKACGCDVEIEPDNVKLQELLDGPVLTHEHYYNQLLKGIRSVL